MFIFDAHLDLSLNALEFNRDLRCSTAELRANETGLTDLRGRGECTVSFPEMRRGNVAICVATLIAGCMKPALPIVSWNSPAQAWAMVQGQMAWYRAMEDEGQLRQLHTWEEVANHLAQWKTDPETTPIGFILSLEGADSLRTLDDLDHAVETHGLKAIGPAHFGKGRYALGHDQNGPLPHSGRDLIRKLNQLNLILDVTHLCDETFWQVLDLYEGDLWASHHNCRSIVDTPRQLSDEQIKALADRGAVIGISLDNAMTIEGWDRSRSNYRNTPTANLEATADHIDHVSQLLGTTKHTGIGTDLDGGFGSSQCPSDIDTIGDIHKLQSTLSNRGYTEQAIKGIAHQNFLDFIKKAWS